MSADKSILDRFMAMPRKELVEDVIYYHDGWIAAGRECNELKAENAKLREEIELVGIAGYLLAMKQLKSDNETIRAERDEWHRVAESKQDIIDHIRDANAENAKLREFIDLKETCWKYVGWCDECPYNGVDDEHDSCICTVQEKIDSLARELGIEVPK